jgi:hypothetical protein
MATHAATINELHNVRILHAAIDSSPTTCLMYMHLHHGVTTATAHSLTNRRSVSSHDTAYPSNFGALGVKTCSAGDLMRSSLARARFTISRLFLPQTCTARAPCRAAHPTPRPLFLLSTKPVCTDSVFVSRRFVFVFWCSCCIGTVTLPPTGSHGFQL